MRVFNLHSAEMFCACTAYDACGKYQVWLLTHLLVRLLQCYILSCRVGPCCHVAACCLGFILEGNTHNYMLKGKPCGFWAGRGRDTGVCEYNIHCYNVRRPVWYRCSIWRQCGSRVTPQSVVSLCHYNDHYNGADFSLDLWWQMSALASTQPSHML